MRNTPERWESGVDGAGTYEWYGTVAPIVPVASGPQPDQFGLCAEDRHG